MNKDFRAHHLRATAEAPSAQAKDAETGATVEQVQADLEAVRNQLLRTAADFQNYRRRTEQEKAMLETHVKRRVLSPVLDVYDDIERALATARDHELPSSCAALLEGVDLVHRKFTQTLERLGVSPMGGVGKPFDENRHEAVMQQPATEETPPGTVIAEVQRGYLLDGEVLRHARVAVAAGEGA